MKKVTAKHTVDRGAARFGAADPVVVCNSIAQAIPLSTLKKSNAILDLGQGCCGISRAIVQRLKDEAYMDHYDAIFKIHGVDNDRALVTKARRLGFLNSVLSDIDAYTPDMNFPVVVGNPPYQNADKTRKAANGRSANGSPLWAKFVRKGASLLAPGGYMSLLLPAAILTPGSRGMSGARHLTLLSVDFNREEFFNVSTDIAQVTWVNEKTDKPLRVNGLEYPRHLPIANVKTQEELELLQKIWSGKADWNYMDNRSHNKIEDKDNYLVIRRMYSGDSYVYNRGLDMTRFDKESLIGIHCTGEEMDHWITFLESDEGLFLRRVTNFAGNISAKHLQYVDPSVVSVR